MEEEKKRISDSNLQREDNNVLPGVGLHYDGQEKGEKLRLFPSRISNALTESIIATTQSIEKKYNLTITDSIIKESVDENGKIPKLSVMQKKVLLSLESHLTQIIDKPEIKEYIEKLKNGENPRNLVSEYISLEDLCSDIYGKEEKWKKSKQNEIKNELKNLSQIRQLQIYKVRAKDESGVNRDMRVQTFAPYLTLTGEEKQLTIGKRTTIAVNIMFGRIFLERINDRFFTILPSFWQAKKRNGEKIRTDHFYSLATLAFSLSWSHYYVDLPNVNKYIQKEGILDTEKIEAMKEKALTHEPIPFDRIRDILKGKTEARAQKKRFKEYLQDALFALIDYGLITEKSEINIKNETIKLVYNEYYATLKQIENNK